MTHSPVTGSHATVPHSRKPSQLVVIVALFGLPFVCTTRWAVIDASKLANSPAQRPHADRRRKKKQRSGRRR